MEKILEKYGLSIHESDNPDRKPIDFSIEDGYDNVCWVWGDTPDDVQIECNHAVVEFDDDDEQKGRCLICGAVCDWHWEKDEGNVEDYHWSGEKRVPHYWQKPSKDKGIVRKYLEKFGGNNGK